MGLNLIFALAIYGLKIKNIRNKKIYDQFQWKFKDYLTYIQANIDSDERLRVPPLKMNPTESKALQDRLNDMVESFAGEQRQKLIDLCGELGFISYHLNRLGSGSYRIKIDAAYHLGCMRVKDAVPDLLELLRRHKLDSCLFIIARAIAKSARHERDVKEMVYILLKHQKGFHDLIVDMIEEAPIDQTALFTEFILDSNPALIQIGLTGLKEYTNPSAASAVHRLLGSRNEEIQRKAAEVYLKSSSILPRNVVSKLLGHAKADIRLLTVQALTDLRNGAYVPLLKQSLNDPDKQVVYASAMALTYQGQEGISALCEGALQARGKEQGEYIQGLIEEEINKLSDDLQDLDKLTRYNALRFTYEKTFDKNKRIYRVV